ncbi:MAG TPA: hypothetical protein EYP58_02505 [bacterium (Candidatus Stahlbacteria)]|nr:hypothetical protein [Candidatus Stahlbacteria bacterium]
MKKIMVLTAMLLAVSSLPARALIELGPKASLYIGDGIQFGIGGEAVVNPLKSIGFRLDIVEVIFDPTTFYFNREGSLDGFFYLPTTLPLYIYAGVGLKTHETGQGTQTNYSVRGGLGYNHQLNPKTNLFIEPGIFISGNGDTKLSGRISAGVRFGVIE